LSKNNFTIYHTQVWARFGRSEWAGPQA